MTGGKEFNILITMLVNLLDVVVFRGKESIQTNEKENNSSYLFSYYWHNRC